MVGALPWRFVTDKNVVAEMKATYPFSSLQYGEEPCMPRPLQMLSHHLHEAYLEHDTSFYATPPYGGIIREVVRLQLVEDLSLRVITFTDSLIE
ncbi:unnamed protein product [Nippostrongylus brasiliensis]|uniref:Cytochrome P450 n=1 Tax=Nippostrongylus brasiliensis TaxID=27835 RepID=A0A0N4XS91_NIPBR|nr:unnamed protein product [Nippostrongylus brasiliensis]